jgi:hypothetical protein
MRKNFSLVLGILLVWMFANMAAAADGASSQNLTVSDRRLPADFLKQFKLRSAHSAEVRTALADRNKNGFNRNTSSVSSTQPGIDSVATWSDQFIVPGYDENGNAQSFWPFTMVGAAPESGRTTTIQAPIVPLTIVGLDANGNVRKDNGHPIIQPVTPDILNAVVQSPFFEPSAYTSGTGQYLDQMMRAQFWDLIHGGHRDNGWDNGWHTLLVPHVKTSKVMRIPSGKYYYAVNSDGTCCAFILIDWNWFFSSLFPPTYPVDSTTPIGAAELAGDITTKDVSTFLANNVYFYQGDPYTNCCIGGFHTYDTEPGIPKNGNRERRYVFNYSPWTTMGIIYNNYGDVAIMSHEMGELFNDPFITNITPWWQSMDPVFGFPRCMDYLESGDVIENFASVPQIYTTLAHGRTYHVVNHALFSWFAFDSPSHAHLGAYSFPDEWTLTTLSPSGLLPNCSNAP